MSPRLPLTLLSLLLAACDGTETGATGAGGGAGDPSWQLVREDLDGALLSVWGTSESDVWTVGGDARDGTGPLVFHHDGSTWERLETGRTEGDLWWVFGFEGGPVYMGGAGGVILRYEGGSFTDMTTPGTGTVFGLWGTSPADMWAVGGTFDADGFAWRLDGDTWAPEPSLPAETVADAALWKVFGTSADEVWLVGSDGVSFSWDGAALTQADTGVGSSLFTVHGNGGRFVAVGGLATGIVVENDGTGWADALAEVAPYGLAGVVLDGTEGGWAVGQYGLVFGRSAGGWAEIDTGLEIQRDLHAVWVDPAGGVWAVGGQTSSFPLTEGLVMYRGDRLVASEGL